MNHLDPGILTGAKQPFTTLVAIATITAAAAAAAAACISANLLLSRDHTGKNRAKYEPSPAQTIVPTLSEQQRRALPYPPEHALPGGRDVDTPYGSIRVYEWGPDDGERVLFVHGISTPVVALGDLGHDMVARGYRVMMFDLFGRGYSDAPLGVDYDGRLYVTQLLLVLASTASSWTTPVSTQSSSGFHLVGYSFGGAVSVAFTRYFPHLVRSLSLVAPCGLIRRERHVGWQSWLYYNSGLLPESLVRYLVRRRIRPVEASKSTTTVMNISDELVVAEGAPGQQNDADAGGDSDANGGAGFNSAVVSRSRPHVTVSSVVAWQVDHHDGFVTAFLSTIRHAPIYAPQGDWVALSDILATRRRRVNEVVHGDDAQQTGIGLRGGKVLIVLGDSDTVIAVDETMEDAYAILGKEGVEFVVLGAGHELPMTHTARLTESIAGFWKSR